MFDSDKRDTAHNVSGEDTITIRMDPWAARDLRDILTHLDEHYSTLDHTLLGCSRSELDSLLDEFQAAITQNGRIVLKIAKKDQLTIEEAPLGPSCLLVSSPMQPSPMQPLDRLDRPPQL